MRFSTTYENTTAETIEIPNKCYNTNLLSVIRITRLTTAVTMD